MTPKINAKNTTDETDGLAVADLVTEDLLVEDVSIDGLCGVY
jgi:mycofactocin precursor